MLDIQTLWLWLAIARMQKNVSWCMNCVTMGTSQSGYLVCFHFHSRTIFSSIFINGIPNWKLITGKDKSLPWIQRLEIAIDSARGLWFLHTFPEGCIVHRDVKVRRPILYTCFVFCISSLHSFLQEIFLVTCSQQIYSSMPTFKQNCPTLGYLKLWTWVSPTWARKWEGHLVMLILSTERITM